MFEIKLSDDKIERSNQIYIEDLIKIKKHIDKAPDFIPKKFIDQIQFYNDGATYRVYFYINSTWKYINLT